MLEVILEAIQKILSEDVPLNDPKYVPLKRADRIVALIQENQDITIPKIAVICEVSEKTIKRDLAKLKAENRVSRVGSLKSGHWVVLNDT
jgi:predicted HTH transcriptional regulator